MPDREDVALYRLYDVNGKLLYVGISSAPERRWAEHQDNKMWWPEVARKTIERVGDRSEALRAEESAIKNERPLYNGTHHRGARYTEEELTALLPPVVSEHLESLLGGKTLSEADFETLLSVISCTSTMVETLSTRMEEWIVAADETSLYADRQVLAKSAAMPPSRLYRVLEKHGRPRDRKTQGADHTTEK